MFFDGSKMLNGAGAGVILVSPRKDEMRYVLQIHFTATNNEAEYEALLYGLRMAISLGIRRLMIFGDSDLVINQVMKEWDIRSQAMTTYCVAVRKLEKKFDGLELHHIPRAQNQAADDLAKLGSTRGQVPSGVYLEHLYSPTVKEDPYLEADPDMLPDKNIPDKEDIPAVVDLVFDIETVPPRWALPILRYLQNQELPADEVEAKQVVRKSKSYSVINNELYRNSVAKIPQRCITEEEGRLVLQDIHSGECGHHASSRTLVAKAFRAGFFWPNALRDTKNIVDQCRGCQFYANQPHKPASELKTIPLAWPFAVWGLDMIGPLRTGTSGFTHILVAVDKFTKWIEAKPIKSLNSATAVSFIRGIIHRFGVPHDIITDNGSNFNSAEFKPFFSDMGYTPRRNRNHSPRNRRDPYDEYHHEQFRNPEFRGGDEHAARMREEDYAARRPAQDVSRREGFERCRVDHQGYQEVEDDARSHLVQNRVDRARMYRHDLGRPRMATGPICFSERIRSTPIPPHFRIAQGVEKYRGDAKPQTWLDDYRIAVQIGGGGDEIAMMHLPLMLEGSARTWLNQLPPNSIWVWEDLVRVFVKNFEGTYKRPGGLIELQLCTQEPTEPTRDYIQRWIKLHNSVEGVPEFQAIHAFKQGVRYKELSLKLARSPDVTSLGRLMEIANKYANGEEEIRQKSQQYRSKGNNSTSNPKQKNGGGSGKRKAEEVPSDAEMVAAANAAGIHKKSQPRKEWQPRQKKPANDDILDQPCPLHTTRDAEGKMVIPKYTARQCRLIKRAAQNAKTGSQQNKEKRRQFGF